MRPLALLLAASLLAGCEPQQQKAERLKKVMDRECFAVAVGRVTPETQSKCDIATANYRKAVDGR